MVEEKKDPSIPRRLSIRSILSVVMVVKSCCSCIRRDIEFESSDILALGFVAVLRVVVTKHTERSKSKSSPPSMADGDEQVSSNRYNFASKCDIDEY